MKRVVLPEILDSLPATDERAVRSRRDLSRINFLMGNERWILNQVSECYDDHSGICEIGAGEGRLLNSLGHKFPSTEFLGIDLITRPAHLLPKIAWYSGDILMLEESLTEPIEVVLVNLFLHHFSREDVQTIIRQFHNAKVWIINEPLRTRPSLMLGKLMNLFVNEVTRHDMEVSIRAGFIAGELESYINPLEWNISEQVDYRGAYRVVLRRKAVS